VPVFMDLLNLSRSFSKEKLSINRPVLGVMKNVITLIVRK